MGRSLAMQRFTHLVSTPGRILLTAVVGILIILLAFVGVSQTLAVWNSQATATGTATGAQLELTTDFGNASADFANHRTSVTGSFSLTNQTITDSAAEATYAASIVAPGAAALRSALTVTIWPQDSQGCTAAAVPADVVSSGAWAQSPFSVNGSLAKGETDTYCMRMQASERSQLASAGGSLIINPAITATLTIGNWADTASGTAVQKTSYVFPAANPAEHVWSQLVSSSTNQCAVSAGTNNGAISSANCASATTSQHWKFTATGDGYQEITPRNNAGLRLDVAGGSTSVGAAINTQNVNQSRVSQDWQMQFKGDVAGKATYQVVNRSSGLCMQAAGSSFTQQECNGSVAQTFTLTTVGVDASLSLSCAAAGNSVTYQLTGAAVGSYVFEFRNGTSGPYAQYSPAVAPGASSVTFTPAQIGSLLASGQNSLRVTWLGYELTTSSVWKNVSGGVTTLGCSAPGLETLSCLQAPPNSVAISWGHEVPSGAQYTIELVAGTGGAGDTQLAVVTSGSSRTLTASNWADGTRTIRVTSSTGSEVEIQIAKSGGTGNGATERLWCIKDVSSTVQVTCDPTSPNNRSTSVTVRWPSGATASNNQVMLEVAGNENELFRSVTTSGANRQFTVPANAFPLGAVGQQTVRMTLIGDTVGGALLLGTKNFDTVRETTYIWGFPVGSELRSRCL